jgi:AraC family transcriptional regulator, positive regulator of tynA and feaB
MSRPAILSSTGNTQCLFMNLPRQTLISHLGFEPQGGLYGRSGTLSTRLLSHFVRHAIEDENSMSAQALIMLASDASTYMRRALYDLLGALFAPSDPASRHNAKLFARLRHH